MSGNTLSPATSPQLPDNVTMAQFLFYSEQHVAGQYLMVASTLWIIYDWFLTLDQEAKYIWGATDRRFTISNALYSLIRYLPICTCVIRSYANLVPLPLDVCAKLRNVTAYLAVINFASVEVVLMLRVWVLYLCSRKVGFFLCAVFACGFGFGLAGRAIGPGTKKLHLVDTLPLSITHCRRSPASVSFWLFLLALLVETPTFILLIAKARDTARRSLSSPLIRELILNGSLYYAVVFVVLALTLFSTLIPAIYQPIADTNIVVPVTSIACSRLILSLRGVYLAQTTTDSKYSHGITRSEDWQPPNRGIGEISLPVVVSHVSTVSLRDNTLRSDRTRHVQV